MAGLLVVEIDGGSWRSGGMLGTGVGHAPLAECTAFCLAKTGLADVDFKGVVLGAGVGALLLFLFLGVFVLTVAAVGIRILREGTDASSNMRVIAIFFIESSLTKKAAT